MTYGALTTTSVLSWLERAIRALSRVHAVDLDTRFREFGLESRHLTQLIAAIAMEFDCELDATAPWTYPTPRALARHIISLLGGVDDTAAAPVALDMPPAETTSVDEPIAVVGIACRLPGGVSSPGELWSLLCGSRTGVTEVPSDRWDANAWFDEDRASPGKSTTRWGGFLDQVDGFDPSFFGISPREAKQIDPQQRIILELGWEALENAAMLPQDLREEPVGVFIGAMWSDYARLIYTAPELIDPHSATGQDTSIISARLSYFLGLQGASLTVNTACSSSMVAIHLACNSLRRGESELALAGGVHVMASPQSTVAMTKFGAMNPAGQCRAFDAGANGYVRGEGAGLVVLEPLSRALAKGHRIYCVIRGSAVNNDGFSNGLTAPNPMAQEAVLRAALANAGVPANTIDYVETHGPGTILGDPIEAGALGAVLGGAHRPAPHPALIIGSVKTNLGHLEAAAGAAGFIKTALCLYHRQIPPNLHFERPNPHIDFNMARLEVPTKIEDWPRPDESRPPRAGVSAFGFGGTNCHAVLEAAPKTRSVLLALAAGTNELRTRVLKLYDIATRLKRHEHVPALARAMNLRAGEGEARVTALVHSRAQLREVLTEVLCEQREISIAPSPPPRLVFVCPGQGSQWHGMARSLMGEPAFRKAIAACDREIEAQCGWSLLDELFVADPKRFLTRPDLVQVSLCSVQIAVGRLWESWGLVPDAFLGHSMGEIAAAHLAGVLTLSEAIQISATRIRLVIEHASDSGGMLVVHLDEGKTVRALVEAAEHLVVAVHSSPRSTVLSGPWDAIERAEEMLEAQGIRHKRVDVRFASHGPGMDPVLDPLRAELHTLAPKRAKIPLRSTTRDAWLAGPECDADYWARNLRDPVRFSQAVTAIANEGPCVFVELSPHPVVLEPIRQILADHPETSETFASGRRGEDERQSVLESVASLFRLGFTPSWDQIHEPESASLPAEIAHMLEPLDEGELEPTPLLLSAMTQTALRAQAARLRAHLHQNESLSLTDVGYTLATRRTHFEHRACVVVSSRADAHEALGALAAGETSAQVQEGAIDEPSKLAVMFTGLGSQRPGMGRQLYASFARFREVFDACCERFDAKLDAPLREVMFADDDPRLHQALYTQPALFTLELALFRLLESFGLAPDVLIGHSIGELVAAHVAGVWSLNDACAFIGARGRLTQALPGGAMASIAADEGEVDSVVRDYAGALDIAAINGPLSVVVSGEDRAVAAIVDHFDLLGCKTKRLAVSHAFHSPKLDPMLDELRAVAASLSYERPSRPLISNLTGKLAGAAALCDPEYWVRQAREAVRFARGVRTLEGLDVQRFVEIGPAAVLSGLAAGCLSDMAAVRASFIPAVRADEHESVSVMLALGQLHISGVEVDWDRLFAAWPARAISLPTYAFQRSRHWLEAPTPEAPEAQEAPLTSLYRVSWSATAANSPPARAGSERSVALLGEVEELDELIDDAFDQRGEVPRVRALAQLRSAPDTIVAPIFGDDPLETTTRALDLVHDWLMDERFESTRLVMLTCQAIASRTGEDVLDLAAAPIWGLLRSVQREQPERRATLVDIDDTHASQAALPAALDRDEDQLIIREGQILVARLEPVERPAAAKVRHAVGSLGGPSALGTVLVTGGTSGLGAIVARHLVEEHGVRQLLLVSRRGPGTPGSDVLRDELEASGAHVTLAACDVANRDAVATLLDSIPAGHPLTAVIHTAGVLDDALLPELGADHLARVFAPKVSAAWHLHELTADRQLRGFVLFSSVVGVLGAPGQANYAAANAWLDALAHHRRAKGLPAHSLDWGPWADVGMAARLSSAAQARLARSGLPATSAKENLAAFDLALALGEASLVPAQFDASALTPAPGRSIASVLRSLARAGSAPTPELPSIKRELRATAQDERLERVLLFIRVEAAETLGLPDPDAIMPNRALRELGLDSLMAIELRNRLQASTGLRLSATLVYDHPTPDALAELLTPKLLDGLDDFDEFDGEPEPLPAIFTSVNPPPSIAASAGSSARPEDQEIAIIGMACRYPGGVNSPEDLWQLVMSRSDALGPFPRDRGWPENLYDPNPSAAGKSLVREGGFLPAIADFDARFFEISPREARAIDPQQRLLLELSWEAIERAGLIPAQLAGSSTGVFVGLSTTDYAARVHADLDAHEGYLATGSAASVASGRIAYTLGLEGPALTVDTACSSSLVALHLAANALRAGECERALVAGATVMSSPNLFIEFSRQGALAPDGRCKAFSALADGTGWSEGGGVLLLERLCDARRLGHPVKAILRGSAVNQDGRSQGLTAPNGPAQQRVIRAALANAKIGAGEVDVVEAHGTGTKLGDPIEAHALLETYGQAHAPEAPLWLGSLKSNIGHTQAAAGVAGVIKMAMAMKYGVLPPTLYADEPSPHVDWSEGAVRLLTDPVPWQVTDRPRRAGVSAFGISGTNAHVLLEQAPADLAALPDIARDPDAEPERVNLFLLSAIDDDALRAQAIRLRAYLGRHKHLPLTDVAYTLATHRTHFGRRACVVAESRADVLDGLGALAADRPSAHVHDHGTLAQESGKLAVLFTGQGSQRGGVGRRLHAEFEVFRDVIEDCWLRFDAVLDAPLREIMFAERDERLHHTAYTQPALFTLELAMFRLLESCGLAPHYMMGHSIGELVAAHAAGVLSLDDACTLVAARGRLMQALPGGGAMASIVATEDEVLTQIARQTDGTLDIAAINGPEAVVVSGDERAVEAVIAAFDAHGRKTRRLTVSHAFHSAHLDPMLDQLREVASGLTFQPAARPIISNLTGELASAGAMADPEYWVRHARGAVRFAPGVQTLERLGVRRFVEVGPRGVLCGLAATCVSEELGARALFVPCLSSGEDESVSVMSALGRLHCSGVELDWERLFRASQAQAVALPTYAFVRQRHWIDPIAHRPVAASIPAPAPAPAPVAADRCEWSSAQSDPAQSGLGEDLAASTWAGDAACGLDPVAETTAPLTPPAASAGPAAETSGPAESWLDRVRHASPEEGQAKLLRRIFDLLARVVYVNPRSLDPDTPFATLGLDSLMSVELRNQLQLATGLGLRATLLFDSDTPRRLAEDLHEMLTRDPSETTDAPLRVVPSAGWREDFALADTLEFEAREQSISAVLLTGATGFVGTHILAELLRVEDLQVHVLVRGRDEDEARRRLTERFARWGLPQALLANAEDRVHVHVGDLAKPRLGLDELSWWRLAARVDAVIANAARVDWLLPYEELREANVLGTLRTLEFAAAGRPKRVCVTSSGGAGIREGDRVMEECAGDQPAYDIGYTLTKLVSETLVLRGVERGLDGVVVRGGLISASTVTGISNPAQIEYRFLRACHEMQAIPDVEMNLDLAPVDMVAAMIVEATMSPDTRGEILHASLPSVYSPRWLQLVMEEIDCESEIVSEARWLELLRGRVDGGDLDLAPLQAFFPGLKSFPHLDMRRARALLASARGEVELSVVISRMLQRIAEGEAHKASCGAE